MVKHWHPLDIPIDSGWGYIVFAGTIVRSPSGRRWWPVLGLSSLMPSEIPNWFANEVPKSFLSGRVSVAPAKLVGINPRHPIPEVEALSDIAGGLPVSQIADPAMAIFDLELPWIDGISPGDFEDLLSDHHEELEEFQSAFRNLMRGYGCSPDGFKGARERFLSAVDELQRSRRLTQFRNIVAKCKGNLTSFPVAMGALAAAGAVYSQDPFAGAAVLGAAGKALRDLWVQAKAESKESVRNPLRLLFRLGVEKAQFRSKRQTARIERVRLPQPREITECHWLCPPSGAGLRFAMLKEE